MEDSESHDKYLEQIASFDPFLNPSDFENIGKESKAKEPSSSSSDHSSKISESIKKTSSNISPVATKTLKTVSSDSEKLKSINNSQNAFYNVDTHYHESPARVPLSTLALPELNQLSSSHSNVTQNIQIAYSPENAKKSKEKNFNDQSPHHSINIYHFNNNTNISSSSGSIKNDNYGSGLASQNKKFECKIYTNRSEYNSTGGTSVDCGPTLRRRSFQNLKAKSNSVQTYRSGRFSITLSSHSEVSQSENSSCEENEKKSESKKKNKKEDTTKNKKEDTTKNKKEDSTKNKKEDTTKNKKDETTKNRKINRFNISVCKNSSNDSANDLLSDCDSENTSLKHASSDKTVGTNGEGNTKNKLIDFDNDDDFFYQMQQSSMPVLGRHKKKNKDSKSNKNTTNINNNNENPAQILNNTESPIIDLTASENQTSSSNNNNSNQIFNSSESPIIDLTTNTNQINNDSIENQSSLTNNKVFSPPKSTPFSPPILEINMNSTSTASSLSGKPCSRSEIEAKGNIDDIINIF